MAGRWRFLKKQEFGLGGFWLRSYRSGTAVRCHVISMNMGYDTMIPNNVNE